MDVEEIVALKKACDRLQTPFDGVSFGSGGTDLDRVIEGFLRLLDELERLRGEVHDCPDCGMSCKQCLCMEKKTAELVAAERETNIALIRQYLLFNSQRAVSWHEVQDCIEAIRARGT